jgi:hypothetical protein
MSRIDCTKAYQTSAIFATLNTVIRREGKAAPQLAKRTLTNLYNEHQTWLDFGAPQVDDARLCGLGWRLHYRMKIFSFGY